MDRVSKYVMFERVGRKKPDAVRAATLTMLLPLYTLVHIIKVDKGKEFARHACVAKAFGAGFFFAAPYHSPSHSWEQGLNEHTNGPPSGNLPERAGFRKVTDAQITVARDLLNTCPRKSLD